LGTSSAADAKIYFNDLDKHLKEFHAMQDGDKELIELAFSKKKADERKEWLRTYRVRNFHTIAKCSLVSILIILLIKSQSQTSSTKSSSFTVWPTISDLYPRWWTV